MRIDELEPLYCASLHGQPLPLRRAGDAAPLLPRGLAKLLNGLDAKNFVIDGEIVVYYPEGRSDFGLMQQRPSESDGGFHCVAFDFLHVNGKNFAALPLLDRKKRLRELVPRGRPRWPNTWPSDAGRRRRVGGRFFAITPRESRRSI